MKNSCCLNIGATPRRRLKVETPFTQKANYAHQSIDWASKLYYYLCHKPFHLVALSQYIQKCNVNYAARRTCTTDLHATSRVQKDPSSDKEAMSKRKNTKRMSVIRIFANSIDELGFNVEANLSNPGKT